MATRIPMVRHGDMLLPVNNEAVEVLRGLPVNEDMAIDIVRVRNGELHKKAFAFLKLAFEYYEPTNHVSRVERLTVEKLGRFLVESGLDRESVRTMSDLFLERLDNDRKGTTFNKHFPSFRDFITVEAGFYTLVITPAGPRKEPKSWAYKNMSQDDFQKLFLAIRNVCWELILSQSFPTIEQADAVAAQMMDFD